MTVEIQVPSILKVGGGCSKDVPAVLKRLGCKHPLIVTDTFLTKSGLAQGLAELIRKAEIECEIFSETVPDPTTEVVAMGVKVFLNWRHDSLVSLRGGSPIDTAKAIGMLAANGGFARDYKVPNAPTKIGPVHVAIPTTARTGSEVSRFTVISDSETNEKMLIVGSVLLPSAAIVDYELTMSMPARLMADTGTDSLTHAIEAYVSRKANASSDMFALTALRTIWQELPTAFHEPGNQQAGEKMMLAATEAGIAFSNASVALVHGMSRPIGAHFHVPHGLSDAMLLPAVTAFSAALTGVSGATLLVGGIPALNADYETIIRDRFPSVMGLVVGGTFLALLCGFRSIFVAIKAIVLNLLSVAASFGALVLVFQGGYGSRFLGVPGGTGSIFPLVPIVTFAIVFGLSMDYEVFLVAHVLEARRSGLSELEAIPEGMARTAGLITSAAAIMIVVFAAFTFGGFLVVKMIGFTLAVAVLIDATVVRIIIGPALLRLAGDWNWWPGGLDESKI